MANIRDLRRRKLLTQQELAQAVGVKKYQTVQRWEAGEAHPRPAQLRRLCDVLSVTPDELLAALDATAHEAAVKEAA